MKFPQFQDNFPRQVIKKFKDISGENRYIYFEYMEYIYKGIYKGIYFEEHSTDNSKRDIFLTPNKDNFNKF